MRRFGWVLTVPIAVVAIVFAVSNNGPAPVSLWPLDVRLDLPVYAVAFLGILIGFLAGATTAWISGRKWRRLARREARDISGLTRDLREKDRQLAATAEQSRAVTPAAGEQAGRPQGGAG